MPKKATKKEKTKKVSRVKSATKKTGSSISTTVKKAVKKVKKQKLPNAPEGKEFFLVNGKKVKNYSELAKVLETLEDQLFRHHVNPERNDFSNWVKDVFQEIELAKKIAGVKTKDHLELVLHRRIARGK